MITQRPSNHNSRVSYRVDGKSWVNNHAHVLRATEAVEIDYLNYSLTYYPFTPLTTGSTGRRKLTQLGLLSAPYKLPPLAEQEQIVAEVERRLSVADDAEARVAAGLKRAARLRQSILKRAFAGQLAPQDPTDEPASALLELIAVERGRTVTAGKAARGAEREATPGDERERQLTLSRIA